MVKAQDNGQQRPALQELNPNMPLPQAFRNARLCNFQDAAELGNAIDPFHGSVHMRVGGTMGNARIAPAAPIFWCWHANLDDGYEEFLSCPSTGRDRSFALFSTDILSDTSKMPSGEVTENLFQEWGDWGKKHFPNFL